MALPGTSLPLFYAAPLPPQLLPVPSFSPISTQISLLISTSFSNSGAHTARSATSNYSSPAIFDPGETDPVPAPSNSLIVDQSGRGGEWAEFKLHRAGL